MIGGIIKKLAGKKALIAISLFPLVKPVVRSLYNSVAGNSFREGAVPLPGSVLYCGLDIGYTEHSGIYVGGGEKCIVELSNRNGESIIKRVTPEEFTGGGLGNSIFVSCHGDASVGNAAAADAALQMVDRDLGRYNIAFNNCHMFTDYCLRSCAEKNHTGDGIPEEKGFIYYLERIASRDMTLTHLKKTAADILEADEWRVWKSKKYNS